MLRGSRGRTNRVYRYFSYQAADARYSICARARTIAALDVEASLMAFVRNLNYVNKYLVHAAEQLFLWLGQISGEIWVNQEIPEGLKLSKISAQIVVRVS